LPVYEMNLLRPQRREPILMYILMAIAISSEGQRKSLASTPQLQNRPNHCVNWKQGEQPASKMWRMKIYIIHLGNMNKRRNIYGRVTNTKQRDGKRQDLKDTNPLVRSGIDIINPALGNSASILTLKP
jgi:hypothetical protein